MLEVGFWVPPCHSFTLSSLPCASAPRCLSAAQPQHSHSPATPLPQMGIGSASFQLRHTLFVDMQLRCSTDTVSMQLIHICSPSHNHSHSHSCAIFQPPISCRSATTSAHSHCFQHFPPLTLQPTPVIPYPMPWLLSSSILVYTTSCLPLHFFTICPRPPACPLPPLPLSLLATSLLATTQASRFFTPRRPRAFRSLFSLSEGENSQQGQG
jgi:hypothetical protein